MFLRAETALHTSQVWHHKLKMLRKLNCIATRISKVTESRWVGRSPNSRCFIPSRPKNSSREDGEPETTRRLARFHHFLDEPRPTQALWHVREMTSSAQWGETLWAVTLRTLHLALYRIKTEREIIHRSHWKLMVQSVTAAQPHTKHKLTFMHKNNTQWHKHTLCILSRLVQ